MIGLYLQELEKDWLTRLLHRIAARLRFCIEAGQFRLGGKR